MKINPLAELLKMPTDKMVTTFLALKSVEKKTAKNGSPFLRAQFSDGEQIYPSTVFEKRPGFDLLSREAKSGDHFKVEARISHSEQYGRQLDIQRIRLVKPEDSAEGYRPEDLYEHSSMNADEAWREIGEFKAKLEPEPLKKTVDLLFEKYGEKFRVAAAAKQAHHAYWGGLMHHTLMMLREAEAIMGVRDFPQVNASLVRAGILLHDLGKVVEMETYPRTEYTMEGRLIGHAAIGLQWLSEKAAEADFSGPLLLHLKHILVSHHGELEFGAAILPQTQEAMLVHLVDNLDAKMEMIRLALTRVDEMTGTTEKLWALDHRTFTPTPTPTPESSLATEGDGGGKAE